MNIEYIDIQKVKELAKKDEYLVWQGCGGPIEEWFEGIQKMMIDEKIASEDYKMSKIYVFTNRNIVKCILTPLNDLDLGKLAILRLQLRATFGTMWLSDFIDNNYI